jgi:carbon-monoxide dehydrogenase medium subunit
MYDFTYHRPERLEDAVALIAENDDAKFLAGGMSLIPILKQRLARPTDLVDLGALPGLKGIWREGDTLVIGAMTPHAQVAASPEVRGAIPALAVLAGGIGDPLVRNRGTIGGSIAHADPVADYPSAVLGLGASVVTNRRQIGADEFFTGLFETALEPGEMITAVRFPLAERTGYLKVPHPASRFALVGVFVAKTKGGVRVAVTGAASSVFRFAAAEAALARKFDPAALADVTLSPEDLNSDIHASAEYRAHGVAVMTRRAVTAALV